MARRRAKGGGRKLKQGVVRKPSGRIADNSQETREMSEQARRDMESRLALETATWKRRQGNPSLTIEDARKPEHGSVLDNWLKISNQFRQRGQPERALISKPQYDALMTFHELTDAYLAAIDARRPRSASEFGRIPGRDGSDPFDSAAAKRDADTIRRFKDARRAILETAPLGMMAVEAVVIENGDCRNMAGDLREAANALCRVWRINKAA